LVIGFAIDAKTRESGAMICRAFDSLTPARSPDGLPVYVACARGSILRTPKVFGAAQTPYNSNRALAARARKYTRQETAIRPIAESTPEFLRIERPEPVH
jgi:hypothetical protein